MSPLYNFLLLAIAHLIASSLIFDPCSVPLYDRQDCGYPGITPNTCVMFGKWSSITSNPMMLVRVISVTASAVLISMYMFTKSGFPSVVAVAYLGLAAMTVFNATRCCHDSSVPYGPHCYF